MSIVADPLTQILSHLGEESCHRVILPALTAFNPQTTIERLVHASWLSEVDAKEAKPKLKEMVKDFPNSKFLRMNLATYYVLRVYWSMADKESRLQLLHTADELSRSIGRTLPVREIAKQLEGKRSSAE